MPISSSPPKIYTIYDIPRPSGMADYLGRIQNVRSRLPVRPGTPDIPRSMDHLTFQSANHIELALLAAEQALSALNAERFYAGEILSGGFSSC